MINNCVLLTLFLLKIARNRKERESERNGRLTILHHLLLHNSGSICICSGKNYL